MKLAYVGIDLLYPALPALRDAGCEILHIFSCKTDNVTEFNTAVLAFAEQNKIPCTTNRLTSADLDKLADQGCQALVCGGYYYRLPIRAGLPMVNIHPSALPVGRGAWPMPVAILRGLTQGGVTLHKMTEGLDEGDILLQETFPLSPRETLQTYMEKVHACLPGMARQLAQNFDALYAGARPQGPGEYWPCPTQADCTLTPDMTAEQADCILRAFYGYECYYQAPDGLYELIGGHIVQQPQPGVRTFALRDGGIEAEKVRKQT